MTTKGFKRSWRSGLVDRNRILSIGTPYGQEYCARLAKWLSLALKTRSQAYFVQRATAGVADLFSVREQIEAVIVIVIEIL